MRDNGKTIKWSQDQIASIAAMMQGGMLASSIALRFGVSRGTIRNLVLKTPELAAIGFVGRHEAVHDVPSIETPEPAEDDEPEQRVRYGITLPWVSIQHEGQGDPNGRAW